MEFCNLTVFVLASNEKQVLEETVDELFQVCEIRDLAEIIIVLKSKDSPAAQTAEKLSSRENPVPVRVYVQQTTKRAEVFSEICPLASGSHFIIMSGDKEMAPVSVRDLIEQAKQHSDAVVCAAKYHPDSVIIGIPLYRQFVDRLFNKTLAFILSEKYYEIFSFFEIIPKRVYSEMSFQRPEDSFFGFSIQPISQGVQYLEIPTVYRKRREGKSTMQLCFLISIAVRFLVTAIRCRRYAARKKGMV